MALMIIDECTSCGLCVDECLSSAILEGDQIYVINPDMCTECAGFYIEPQCVKVCPADAIKPDPAHCESIEDLLKKQKHIYGE
ncbi:MAG: YfhL family 4Fe-4S dicluster ferredoxin [Bacteroidales bacterium]|jgi:ferredoxin|nr:YfhL family 4Fe-4S dicluster ferredoxin [Bacteroidales bacterium]